MQDSFELQTNQPLESVGGVITHYNFRVDFQQLPIKGCTKSLTITPGGDIELETVQNYTESHDYIEEKGRKVPHHTYHQITLGNLDAAVNIRYEYDAPNNQPFRLELMMNITALEWKSLKRLINWIISTVTKEFNSLPLDDLEIENIVFVLSLRVAPEGVQPFKKKIPLYLPKGRHTPLEHPRNAEQALKLYQLCCAAIDRINSEVEV